MEERSKALDLEKAQMEVEARAETREGLRRDLIESRKELGIEAAEESDAESEGREAVPPQVLKERIESVVEVLGDFQVRRGSCTQGS